MNKEEILLAFKAGKLTTIEAYMKLKELQAQSLKSSLSEGQKGLWILQKTTPDMSAYNVPICFRISRKLDAGKFQQACTFILEQYPILTTVIHEEHGVPYQTIQSSQPLFFESEDISMLDSEAVLPYLRKKVKIPFILEQGPLIRVYQLTRSAQAEIILIVIHHIIFDGSSLVYFIEKLLQTYQDLLQNRAPKLIPFSANYNDFVKWEMEMLASEDGEEHLSYWKQQLSGMLSVLELPTDHPRSATPSFEGQVYPKRLSPKLANQIKVFANAINLKPSVLFLGIFKILLHRYTNQEDIIVGMPTFGRPQERFSSLIGYFINLIAIRSQVSGIKSFTDYIRELQLTVVDGLDHAIYPFPTLVRKLNVPRIPGNSPIFQVLYLYQNFFQPLKPEPSEPDLNRLPVEMMEGIHQEGEYELELEVFEQGDAFVLNFKYNPRLFNEATIFRMVEHYLNLTNEIIKNPKMVLDEYSFLSKTEAKLIQSDWNATQTDYPIEKCMHQLFEEQVQKAPDEIAVIFEDETLTYRELDHKSAQLAIYLQGLGIKPDRLVGICVERHWEMVVGLLGILKAGGAYVPLDPDYPGERLEYMIENSKIAVLITQTRVMPKIKPLIGKKLKVVMIDQDWSEIEQQAPTEKLLQKEVKPDHLAYVIYTSGSTGKPKGVMIPHQALTNFLISMSQKPGLNSQDRLLAVTTFCFDIAGLELYLPLINGAKLSICSSEKAKDVEKLKQEIQKCQPTIMQATPVTWSMLFRTGWKNEVRLKILCGGEALSETLKQSFMDNHGELWNMFGPTETTIWSTIEYIREAEPITLGKPIANTRIYIVDGNFKPTPIGIPGELCIAGDGLARGYLNQPELTAEKFVPNPFVGGTDWERMYRTGDLARWTIDGKIEFLGRIDHQVKIRGFRIELGEIESQLAAHPDIQDCAVIVKEQADHNQLAVFYTAKKQLGQQQLRAYLRHKLPEYMLPSHFIAITQMPLTPNGKHDRKALANRPVSTLRTVEPEAKPHFTIVEKVLNIWKEVLNTNDIGIEDGFFDVGGDSFLAVTVAQRIKDNFQCDFNVTELFQYTNVKEISNYLSKIKGDAQSPTSIDIKPEVAVHQKNIPLDPLLPSIYPPYYQNSVAVIGISCHFPGAKNYFEFWNNLRAGTESIKFFSKEELASLNLPKELVENPNFIPVQATIDDKDFFDANFFSISPRDAEYMDPQFRLLLLHSWKAVEDAGYIPKQIPETSVFMSASNHLYLAILSDIKRSSEKPVDNWEGYVAWLLGQGGTIPTMISHKFGFKGPSFFVHSNCSSSLVELHLAFQSLCSGEAKYALVGAASISTLSNVGYIYEKGLNFAGDGHVKAFDASADGMVGGEGVAVIVLKKAIDAIQDGDHIYALLRGTGVNNDGSDKVGFYAPSVKGQAEVIKKVLDSTQIHPESISYIEASSTGTKLGDPIEVAALNDIYQQYTSKKQFCGIGSVKTNIGHLDTAAGLAGCIKVALSLYYHEIPPSINYREPNPNLNLKNSPFYIVNQLVKLEKTIVPYRAALSSFGIGGTNTHAIFEEYPDNDEPQFGNDESNLASFIIPLSAKNDERLKVYAQELVEFLKVKSLPAHDTRQNMIHEVNRLAYTLQVGREAMESRVVFIIKDKNDLIHKLEEFIGGNKKLEGCFTGKINQATDKVQLFENEADSKEILQKWFTEGQGRKLAQLWVKGFQIHWEMLYDHPKPRRISLPTYPFAKESYRIPEYYGLPKIEIKTGGMQPQAACAGSHALHPLLHQKDVNQSHKSTVDNIRDNLCIALNQELKLPAEKIDFNKSFLEYGVDSIISLRIIRDLTERYQLHLTGREILEYPTIDSFATFLAERIDGTENQLTTSKPCAELTIEKPVTQECATHLCATHLCVKYPLSEVQKGLWVIQNFSPQNTAYNVPFPVRIKEKFDPACFKKAGQFILKQYPILNTMIREENGSLYQTIDPTRELDFYQEDISDLDEKEVVGFLRKKAKIPFDLKTSPLFRVYLFSRSDREHIVLIVIHHIIIDGTSLLLFNSLWKAYHEYAQNREPAIIPEQASYYDFVQWEQEMLTGPEGEKHLAYWKKQLTGELHPVLLPTDHSRSAIPSFNGITYETKLSNDLSLKVRQMAKSQNVSLATLFLGIYKVFLYKYTGQTDICLNVPTIGRPQRRFDSVMGMFINLAIIRTQLPVELSFNEFLKNLRIHFFDGVYHADYPFQALARYFKENLNVDISGLTRVDYTYQNYVRPDSFDDLKITRDSLFLETVEGLHQEGADEFGLEIFEAADNFLLNFEYNPDLFDSTTIERMVSHFITLIDRITAEPEKPIGSYEVLSDAQRRQILTQWSHTEVLYPKDKCIHQLFEAQAQKQGGRIAVSFAGDQITYRELNQKSTKLAVYLQSQGMKPGALVGIYIDRSIEMIIGVLGILKAGGAYVPLASNYPDDRIQYMLENSNIKLLITQEQLRNRLNEVVGDQAYPIIIIDKDLGRLEITQSSLKRKAHPEDLAYVIYTSGSTGKPKGVMVTHGNLVNAFYAWQDAYELSGNDTHLQMAAFSFDVFAGDWTRALCSGAKLVICPHEWLLDPENLYQLMQGERISCAEFVPAVLRALIRYLEKAKKDLAFMRLLIAGSDIWYVKEYQEFKHYCGPNTRLINSYGLTEATIDSTYFEGTSIELTPERYIPIGRPFANTHIFILDQYLQPVPIGVLGELYVGGAGVVRGYLNQPELTAEKLVVRAFRETPQRIYKTGDLARWLPDGNIEFLGRADHQVKVRGFRIELGEIENQLTNIPQVKEAVVIAKGDDEGNAFLVAVIVSDDKETDMEAIKTILKSVLPEYMIPSVIIQLDHLPLSPSGKVDKKALMALKVEMQSAHEYLAPRNETETILAEIFGEVLHIQKISMNDNFFELGGHSLLVVKALYMIQDKLGRKINVRDFYSFNTIEELGRFILEGGKADEIIDLQREAVLDADIQPCGKVLLTINHKKILLTGCTGFVGRFLLHDLLNRTESTIYCLVRSKSTDQAFERIKRSLTEFELWDPSYEKKIVPIAGDLSKPEFGIEKIEYLKLCKDIDEIYHCATYMNHLATYQEMKNTTVEGTKRILRFACAKKQKRIQYISTLGIFNMDKSRKIDETTPIEYETHYNSAGYNSSKWVAEKIMMIARERRISCNIYRLGLVTGDSQKGRCDSSQIFYRFLQSYLELGCYGYDNIDMKIWITPVDFVSQAIVYLSQSPDLNQNYLLVNNEAINYIELIKYYNTGAKKPLQIVTSAEYFQKIKEYIKKGNTLPIVPIIQDMLNLSEEEIKAIQSKLNDPETSPAIHFNSSRTLQILNKGGVKLPEINAMLIQRYFDNIAQK